MDSLHTRVCTMVSGRIVIARTHISSTSAAGQVVNCTAKEPCENAKTAKQKWGRNQRTRSPNVKPKNFSVPFSQRIHLISTDLRKAYSSARYSRTKHAPSSDLWCCWESGCPLFDIADSLLHCGSLVLQFVLADPAVRPLPWQPGVSQDPPNLNARDRADKLTNSRT